MQLHITFKAVPMFKQFKDLETGLNFRKTGASQAFHILSEDYAVIGEDRIVEIEIAEIGLIAFDRLNVRDYFFTYNRLAQKVDNETAVLCNNGRLIKIKDNRKFIKVIL